MRILIAEDDVITSRSLQENLRDWGYDTLVVHNGKEAWELISGKSQAAFEPSEDIRLAILDWEMPGINGVDLCRRIRDKTENEQEKYIYIILLTGRDLQEDIITGLTAGADDYLTKPFDILELQIRIKNGERIIRREDSRFKMATTDNLTQLWNRNRILEFLKEETSRGERFQHTIGVLMTDIDFFKKINDEKGHQAGDKVLLEISTRIKKSARSYDKIGRYGGDEFLGVFPNCPHSFIPKIAERFREAVEAEYVQTASGPIKVTISIGGTSNEFGRYISADDMIRVSDQALLTAKNNGRNCSVIVTPEE